MKIITPSWRINKKIINDQIHREEVRFHRTLEAGLIQLEEIMSDPVVVKRN